MSTRKLSKSLQDTVKAGYLEDKKVILKPVPRAGKMVGLDQPQHVNFFMATGCSENFVIMMDERGDRIDIFESDEEREFFEKKLGKEMNIYNDTGYLANLSVKVTKDEFLMEFGEEYDLLKPADNLRVRILKTNNTIAPSWEERYERPYKWALVDKDAENQKEAEEFSVQQRAWMKAGNLMDSEDKARKFLQVYIADTKSTKQVGKDKDKDWMKGEISNLLTENADKFLSTIENDFYEQKVFALKALEVGGINKTGVDTYVFSGEEETYTFKLLAEKIKELGDSQDDIYMKLVGLIKAV